MLARLPRSPLALDPLIAEANRRARRRRWSLLFALVVVAAAVATFALRSAAGSSLATVGGGPVVHIALQESPSTVSFNLKTGHKAAQTVGEEMWLDRRSGLRHIVSTLGGRPVLDEVSKSRYRPGTQAAAVDRFYVALATDYRAALRSGKVKLVSRGTFGGHRIDWLRVTSRGDERFYVLRVLGEVGVDARTFEPVLLRGRTGEHYFYTRILAARAIAYDAGDFKGSAPSRDRPSPVRLAPGYASGTTDSAASRGTDVRGPWLTAGKTAAGLELQAVKPFTIRRSKHHFTYGAPTPKPIHGLELVYAPAPRDASALPSLINLYGPAWEPGTSTRATTVYEVPRAPRVPPWSTVPAGSMKVQTGLTSVGSRVVRTLSIGYLRERGLFITIRTPQGPHTALQLARSLHGTRR